MPRSDSPKTLSPAETFFFSRRSGDEALAS